MEAEAELVAFNVCRELKSSRLQGGGGVGTGQETPAGRDGTMSGDTPRGRRHNLGQAGTGGLRAGATGAGVLALPWLGAGGHQQSSFSPLTAPISCFPHPHPRSCSPSLPWGSGTGSVPATGPCPKPQTKGCPRGGGSSWGLFCPRKMLADDTSWLWLSAQAPHPAASPSHHPPCPARCSLGEEI